MNILITGATGFVGEYLAHELCKSKNNRIFGIDRSVREFELFPNLNDKVKLFTLDITNYDSVKKVIGIIKPENVYHLAGFSSASGQDKKLIDDINVGGTLNLLKALKTINQKTRVLLVSSSYVYSDTLKPSKETDKIAPKSLYAKSKARMEKESLKYASKKLEILIARPINHIGPGQRKGFVVPDFACQIVGLKNGETISVGNLSARRDFLDVVDVVRAYKAIIEKGKSSEIYNISSGNIYTIKEILEKMIKVSKKKISIKIDTSKFKEVDIKKNALSNKKIVALGWRNRESIDITLKKVLNYWKKQKV